MSSDMSGTLYIVATPIGNLDDISRRATDILASVATVAAEDTRRTRQLLAHYGISTPCISLHEHNETAKSADIIRQIKDGVDIALVSDAGTPLLSDPGYRLVSAAHAEGVTVCPIPGASAVIAALSVAGLPSDRFCFEGFLPAKKAARLATLRLLAGEARTMIFFESVHRVEKSLLDLCEVFGAARPAFIAREISKVYEQYVRATLGELLDAVQSGAIVVKGEFVIAVGGVELTASEAPNMELLLRELKAALPLKQAAAIAARVTGGRRNELYARLLELDGND